jgi:hypothetical protein
MRHDFYKAINKYKEEAESTLEWGSLDDESKRYVDRVLRNF